MNLKTIAWMTCTLLFATATAVTQTEKTKLTYAIEINGVLCGYGDVEHSTVQDENGQYVLMTQHLFFLLSALGFEVNREVDITYHFDSATGAFTFADIQIDSGETQLRSQTTIEGSVATCDPLLGDTTVSIDLPAGATLENSLFFPHLIRDFVTLGVATRDYQVLAVEAAAIHTVTYTSAGSEELELGGEKRLSIRLERVNKTTGGKQTYWIDTEQGILLKAEHGNGQTVYLADPSIRKRIELANLDQNIAVKTNVTITDVENITYLKAKVKIEPTGSWLSVADLNVPGQQFEGTVENNVIEGIFEIEQPHFDGCGAPAYPPPFQTEATLHEYLEPEPMIECADAVLVEKAEQIAEGSKDSWEAACRLSQWVADNIDYEIPGGLTARGAFEIRAGECGAHSLLLAALCRAVGIPARVVWGCVYTRTFGGAFGQHAWTEIYMGDAGWIPVDSTGFEADFVDSGHIRLGVLHATGISLNAKSIEILDYRLGSGAVSEAKPDIPAMYVPYVGEYVRAGLEDPVQVYVKDEHLTVEVPNSAVLPLRNPDEHGFWVFERSEKIRFSFDQDAAGNVVAMNLHRTHRMRRRSEPTEVGEAVPEPLLQYLGGYLLAGVSGEFIVLCRDGELALREPTNQMVVPLQKAEEDGTWTSTLSGNRISFSKDAEGKVSALILATKEVMLRLQ